MKLRFAFTMLVFLLSATAFGQEANWWYEKYQKLGDTDPKWDALVREGIDHWAKAYDPKTGRTDSAELALSVEALEKAYAAGCRSPIALFIDARNLALTGNNYGTNVERFRLALARAAGKPELDFIRFYCANLQGWDYKSRGAYKEAVESFELALSIRAPEVDEQIRKEAESGLQQAKEQLAVQQEQSAHLAALTLPPHPTKEQARAYARQVLLQAAKRSAPAWNDPAIAMLEKVGPENLDVLLELWGTTVTSSLQILIVHNDVEAAVKGLVRPEHKALLLKWLPLGEFLADPMQRQGWIQEMRPFLVERIAERSPYTDVGVLHAAAALRDPATYDDLIWHFENNQNGLNIYDDLKNLPGIQLKDAVVRMWAASKSWTGFKAESRCQVAEAAMDYGSADALEFAVAKFDSPATNDWYREKLGKAIRERTGLLGPDKDIHTWFEANKGKLAFDSNRRRFVPAP